MKTPKYPLIFGTLIFLFSTAFAQTDGTRVTFKRGANSATRSGTVAKGGPDFYLIGAGAGQTMTVKVTGKVTFGIDKDGERVTTDDGNTTWSQKLLSGGDYKVKVFSTGGAQTYTLTIAIAQASKPAAAFPTSGFYQGINLSSKESGDYYGINVYLTESDGQLFALANTAEGGFSSPVLVEAKQSGPDMRTVEFTLPDANNGDRKIRGTVSATALTLADYNGKKMIVKRACGNLASNITMGPGGDYGGIEVYTMDAGGPSYALVTIAEGVLRRPVLVDANINYKNGARQDNFDFTVPSDNGARKYKGIFTKTGMTLDEGGTKSVLKMKC